MKEELQEKLVKKYPNLYKNYGGDPRKTCMAWGFSCGNGWYKLIDELSAKLEPLGIVAAQVKEKFSTLRFYTDIYSEESDKYISIAVKKSSKTCENCGEPGKCNTTGYWLKTLCDSCREKIKKETTAKIKMIKETK